MTTPTKVAPNVLSWATDLDPNTLDQAARLAQMPFIEGHVALMPDAHLGKGATVGSVIATKGAVIPAAVGVDIGCGMIAACLDLTSHDLPDDLAPLHRGIADAVPAGVGKGHQHGRDIATAKPTRAWDRFGDGLVGTARSQIGTLGSGNHFVEVCLDEDDRVWLVLHSGSRGVGNKLASFHIEHAQRLMKEWFINLADRDLAYLVQGTPDFDEYISDMLWAQDYAMTNRSLMLEATLAAVSEFLVRPVQVEDQINCHHNFTQMERHHGKNVWLTRKGAIKADTGARGVIPGSMGTRSYIVSGRGSEASFCSCSHGAGRRLSRTKARQELSVESLESAMRGIAWNGSGALLDEHPDAYKDIDTVMENQRDLVSVDHTLHQILNYKGT